MQVRIAEAADVEGWVKLRAMLWPSASLGTHWDEASSAVLAESEDKLVLVAIDCRGEVCGFAEASLRGDYVNGCETSPVAFLEGIYVSPEHRASGVGRELCTTVEAWGRDRGCQELASDALLTNVESHAFHSAIGFEETERVVYFRKCL